MQVFKLEVKPFLLDFAVSDRFVEHVLILLPQVSKFDALLSLERVDGHLYPFSPLLHPSLVLLPLYLEDLLLDLVSF